MSDPTKVTRSIILINKPFQIRYCIYVCSWLFALTVIFPVMVHTIYNNFLEFALLHFSEQMVSIIRQKGQELVMVLAMFEGVFIVVTFLISIFISHKIAGPLFKLEKMMQSSSTHRRLEGGLVFRKADHFQSLADTYNQMVESIRGREKEQIEKLSTALHKMSTAMDRSGHSSPEMLSAMKDLQEIKNQLLSP